MSVFFKLIFQHTIEKFYRKKQMRRGAGLLKKIRLLLKTITIAIINFKEKRMLYVGETIIENIERELYGEEEDPSDEIIANFSEEEKLELADRLELAAKKVCAALRGWEGVYDEK